MGKKELGTNEAIFKKLPVVTAPKREENKVIIELKSVETLAPVHPKQLLTYLKLTGLKLGLLINFDEILIKDGIIRIVNNL